MATIRLPAKKYEDCDNCLAAAELDIAIHRGLAGWDLSPRWEDNEREHILLDVPHFALRSDDDLPE
jgi:hypothetical protein